MRSAYCRWLLVALLAASSGVATTGCGNDQKTINRVQPNALEKKMFQGEWYMKGTVIDTQVDAPIFVGTETGFNRIQWDIQEDYLIARRTYQHVRGIETGSVIGDANEQNSVIAVYKIQSHFDIRRDYNPATGEKTNVVLENTTDRPWFEREFMRVDWSQNLLDNGGISNGIGSVKLTPVALYEQDIGQENDELKPHFERDADDRVTYFDLVNKFWAEPALAPLDVDGDGKDEMVPSCLQTVNSHMDCAPGAVQIRYSFAQVQDRDYQPVEYTADRMARFGYFVTKRDQYDVDYGTTVGGRMVFASRHNIWMQSHLRNDAGDLITCSARDAKAEDAELAGRKLQAKDRSACMKLDIASRCDIAMAHAYGTQQGACTIPYEKRDIRPIAYYVTPNLPEYLWPDAAELGRQWNIAFTETVASLRRIECEDKGGGKSCATKYTPEKTERIFAVCHNPVTTKDEKVCGEVGFSPRFGDVRYNIISWVEDAHGKYAGAPLGLGPAQPDPITGEVISGVANLYGDGFDQYATFARDTLAMMHGDLKETDPQSNAAFEAWIEKSRKDAVAATSVREADRHVIKLDGWDMQEANADMNFEWALNRLPKYPQPASLSYIKQYADAQWKAIGDMHEQLHFARTGAANIASLRGTWIEDLMVTDEYNNMVGLAPGQTLPEQDKKRLSPLSAAGSFGIRGQLEAQRNLVRAHGNELGCLIQAGDFDDDGLVGLMNEVEKAVTSGDGTVTWYGVKYQVGKGKKIDYELVKEMIKHPMFFGLTTHEVGHTLGLRHNFSGSYDALNFQPTYWKLRNDGTIRSRAFDPMSQREINGRIREYQYTTVMDYGHNFVVTEAHGVGHYDKAAIKMGYGDLAEVFTEAPTTNVDTIAQIDAQASPFMVFIVDPRGGQSTIKALHYSSWPELVGGIDNIEKRRDVPYKKLTFVNSPFFGDGGFSKYDEGGKSYAVVPYIYCGDEFADSRPTCMRYDAGADAYETLQSVIDNYWDYYPFSNFMRQRIGWDPAGVPVRTKSRFFDKLSSAAHIYALYRHFFEPFLGDTFFEAEDGFGLYTLGVRATYDLYRQVIATPEPSRSGGGGLGLKVEELVDGRKIVTSDPAGSLFDEASNLTIDSFNGRYLRSDFDIGPSFEWIYFTSSGWFKEKQLAIESLLYADTGFLGTDTSPDVREYSSSFYTIFPDSMAEFMRALYAGDVLTYAPRVNGTEWVYPTPADILSRGKKVKGTAVSPNVGFTLQLSAMAYGMMLIPNTFDQDFVNRSRIFVAGSSDGVDFDLPDGTVGFKDDRSGMTYYAGSYVRDDIKGMEGTKLETGSGAAMINFAKALKARVDKAVTDGNEGEAAVWQAKLQDFVDNLDIVRFLSSRLGHGSDGDFLRNQ